MPAAPLALNLSPGPDLISILSRSIAHGRRVGLPSAAGVCTGAFVRVLAASVGLSAILATSATAFTVVKYVGAAYLIYRGIKSLRSAGSTFGSARDTEQHVSLWRAFRKGVLIDVLNPKVSLMRRGGTPMALSRAFWLIPMGDRLVAHALHFASASREDRPVPGLD